jgi:hypothetical protein
MRNLILTLAATTTLLFGGLVWTDTAEARPRWRGGYWRAPAVRYYRPYRPYYGSYYRGPSRYYSRYYGYPAYRYSWGGPGFYFRF